MTAIPQRLREIAVRIGTHDMAAYVQLRAIAAELEAPPAADAVPVVAVTDEMIATYLRANDAYWTKADGLPTKLGEWRAGTPKEATRESLAAVLRDHLAAIASEREHASKLRETFLRMQQEHAGSIAALQARINALESQKEIDVEQGNVSVAQYSSVLRQLSDAQARINELEARQAPESAKDRHIVVWPSGSTFTAGSLRQAQDYMDGAMPRCIELGDPPPTIVRYAPAETVPYEPQPDTSKEKS